MQQQLTDVGIGTLLHYPVPPHRSGAYAGGPSGEGTLPITERLAQTDLSLPMGPHLTVEQRQLVAASTRQAIENLHTA